MKIKGFFINLGCICFSLMITFAILEIAFRIDKTKKQNAIENFKYISPKGGPGSKEFRGQMPKVNNPKTGYRIIALGDSVTWGDKVSDPKNVWTNVLEGKLNEKYKDKNIKVINAGWCGWTTVNELEYFILYGRKIEPDMIIMQYSLNDPLPSDKRFQRVGGDWLKKQIVKKYWKSQKDNLYDRIFSKSEFLKWLKDRIISLRMKKDDKNLFSLIYDDNFQGWKNTQKSFSIISAESKKIGAPAILMLAPSLIKGNWNKQTYPYAQINEKVIKSATLSGMYVVDTMPNFYATQKNFIEFQAIRDADSHPGVEAQKIMADSVYELIIEKKLIN